MIAIVNILDRKGDVMNKQIGLYFYGAETEEVKVRIPKEFQFHCWNSEYAGKDLLVKVI